MRRKQLRVQQREKIIRVHPEHLGRGARTQDLDAVELAPDVVEKVSVHRGKER